MGKPKKKKITKLDRYRIRSKAGKKGAMMTHSVFELPHLSEFIEFLKPYELDESGCTNIVPYFGKPTIELKRVSGSLIKRGAMGEPLSKFIKKDIQSVES